MQLTWTPLSWVICLVYIEIKEIPPQQQGQNSSMHNVAVCNIAGIIKAVFHHTNTRKLRSIPSAQSFIVFYEFLHTAPENATLSIGSNSPQMFCLCLYPAVVTSWGISLLSQGPRQSTLGSWVWRMWGCSIAQCYRVPAKQRAEWTVFTLSLGI